MTIEEIAKKVENYYDSEMHIKAGFDTEETILWLWHKQLKRKWKYMIIVGFALIYSICAFVFMGVNVKWFCVQMILIQITNVMLMPDWGRYRNRSKETLASTRWHIDNEKEIFEELKPFLKEISDEQMD